MFEDVIDTVQRWHESFGAKSFVLRSVTCGNAFNEALHSMVM
jgi:hypothetical protein